MRVAALGSAVPLPVSPEAAALPVNVAPSDTEENNGEEDASTSQTVFPVRPDVHTPLVTDSATKTTGMPNAVSRDIARKPLSRPIARKYNHRS